MRKLGLIAIAMVAIFGAAMGCGQSGVKNAGSTKASGRPNDPNKAANLVGRYQLVMGRIPAAMQSGFPAGDYQFMFLVDTETGRVWWAEEYAGVPIFQPAPVGEPTASTKVALPSNCHFSTAPKSDGAKGVSAGEPPPGARIRDYTQIK
jgi:hypothetical protein